MTRLLGVGVGLVDLFDFGTQRLAFLKCTRFPLQRVAVRMCVCVCACVSFLFFVVLAKETSLCHKLFPVGMKKLCRSLLFSKEHVEDGERRSFLSVSVTPPFSNC